MVSRFRRRYLAAATSIIYTLVSFACHQVDCQSVQAPWQSLWEQLQHHLSLTTPQEELTQPEIPIAKHPAHSGEATQHRRRSLYQHSLHEHYSGFWNNTGDNSPTERAFSAYLHALDEASSLPLDRTTSLRAALPPFPESKVQANKELIADMFVTAYDAYMYNGWPAGEVRPLTCKPGVFKLIELPALTVIDALDTLIVMGNTTEFARSVERLRQHAPLFDVDANVSLFETNIRVLGGLLSAHQLAEAYWNTEAIPVVLKTSVWTADGRVLDGRLESEAQFCTEGGSESMVCQTSLFPLDECRRTDLTHNKAKNVTQQVYKYDGILLQWAEDLADRLLPAFDTRTGIPYGTINLQYGVPHGETKIASLAGAGTLNLEMTLLSRLTGNPKYGKAARLASRALWMRRSQHDLFGKHINIESGQWTETLSGIGSNSDSFLEYLAKHAFLFPEDDDFWSMLIVAYRGVFEGSRNGEWYVDVDMNKGASRGHVRHVLESLMAFFPGLQVLLGESVPAAKSLNGIFSVRELLGFLPERFHFGNWRVDGHGGAAKHPLRPELLESAYLLHRATRHLGDGKPTSGWQWASDFALQKLQATRTPCGYAGVRDVRTKTTGSVDGSTDGIKYMDEMPSFFLSETLKYLYLTFDEDNVLHNDKERQWIFTTEAHPIHYVPKTRNRVQVNNVFPEPHSKDIETLKLILGDKLYGRKRGRTASVRDLRSEKWTEVIDQSAYRTTLFNLRNHLGRLESHKTANATTSAFFDDRPMIEPVVSESMVDLDSFSETRSGNAAHLGLSSLGLSEGFGLSKSCPNVYGAEMLWMHALHGGALDYADVHLSAMTDDRMEHVNYYAVVGSSEALGLLGTGVYLGRTPTEDNACPLHTMEESNSTEKETDDVEETATEDPALVEVESDIGVFEVMTFAGGAGFYVQHKETGERIIATFIVEVEEEKPFVLAYGAFPVLDKAEDSAVVMGQRVGVSWDATLGVEERKSVHDEKLFERKVTFGDFYGNTISCEVVVVRKGLAEGVVDASDSEELLLRVPCSSGMFGGARLARVAAGGDVVIEAPIVGPPEGDAHSCSSSSPIPSNGPTDELIPSIFVEPTKQADADFVGPVCDGRVIRLVHRGICNFERKVMVAQEHHQADAVIVINTEDDELFVMSKGVEGEPDVDDSNTVPSVLVTGLDGSDLLELVNRSLEDDEGTLVGRVLLRLQDSTLDSESGRIVSPSLDTVHWPVVRGADSAVQVLSRSGWGVQAVYARTPAGGPAWQLQLLRHDVSSIV